MRRKHTDHASGSRIDVAGARNPLIRRSDRIQSRAKAVVVTLAILMIPIAAWFGVATLSSQQDRVADQQYSRHEVTASTTAEAQAGSALVQSDFSAPSTVTVDAAWTYRGVAHNDTVSVAAGSPAGTPTAIWVDDSGARSSAPISTGDAYAAALFTGIGSLLAVTFLLLGIYSALRFHLDTKRNADWDLAIKNFMDENSIS